MVVEVFVAQSQGVDPLGNELLAGVLGELRITMVGEARGELADDAGEILRFAEQQAATVGGDVAPIKRGEDLTRSENREIQVG